MPAISERQIIHYKHKSEANEEPVVCAGAAHQQQTNHSSKVDDVTCRICIIRLIDIALRHIKQNSTQI